MNECRLGVSNISSSLLTGFFLDPGRVSPFRQPVCTMIDGQSLSLVRDPSSYCKLLSDIVWSHFETVEIGHLSWYKFSPQNKQTPASLKTYERFKYKPDIFFQLISQSDRHVFYFFLRHLSPWHRTNTRHALSLNRPPMTLLFLYKNKSMIILSSYSFPYILAVPFRSIHLHFFQTSPNFFPVLAVANTGSRIK